MAVFLDRKTELTFRRRCLRACSCSTVCKLEGATDHGAFGTATSFSVVLSVGMLIMLEAGRRFGIRAVQERMQEIQPNV